jgi:hypothetical protein
LFIYIYIYIYIDSEITNVAVLSEFIIFRFLSGGCDEGRTYTGNDPRTAKNFLSPSSPSSTRQFSAREAATDKLGVSFQAELKVGWSQVHVKIHTVLFYRRETK